jgi:formylglycine-generating enzyme required for sulfatase activity
LSGGLSNIDSGELPVSNGRDRVAGMVAVPGGAFTMGSDRFYPEEAPARTVRVEPFLIDETPVTNRAFAEFVASTGYQTSAEIAPDPKDYPGMPPDMARAGSVVFQRTDRPVDLIDASQWWAYVVGANWRHPLGPGSSIEGLADHPVVHVTFQDAAAYADWAGKSLPTEAEWECAARGGLENADYAWGDELAPDGVMMANYWQGLFPFSNTLEDGWERTSPVRTYAPNGYGLYDTIGNVWEWTADWYAAPKVDRKKKGACCVPLNPRGPRRDESYDPHEPARVPRKVLKGGSHLCAASYCRRYRPAARHPEPIDTSTSHVGFRCVVRRQPRKL